MLSRVIRFSVVGAVALVFAACSLPPFQVTELTPEGHRLVLSDNKPLGCMLVGEKTGLARIGKTEATREKLIESARNDLLNNSVYLADTGANKDNKKRLVVYPAKTEVMCGRLEEPCESSNPKIKDISALKIYG